MFKRRAEESERLDDPSWDPQLARQAFIFMQSVNRWLGGTRAVRRFVLAEAARCKDRPLRVLDIGSGSCDIPLAVTEWAARHDLDVNFTCLDINRQAADLCRTNLPAAGGHVHLLEEDVFHHHPPQPYHCAVGSMFFHHLKDSEILRLMEHLRGHVMQAVLINDLLRSPLHYAGAWLLTRPLHTDIQHDALVSIRRSFRPADLRRLLEQLPDVEVRAWTAWLMRVEATVRFVRRQ